MSRSIDERIVDMKFNNKEFEEGIRDSLDSIDNLKKGLNGMDGASKGLDEVGESTQKLGLDFDALQIIALTALAKITSAAVDFALDMAKSLTIEPLIDGFNAYEKQIESTKAIMNATRKDVDEVGEALERLIFFADETSFSFEQMITSVKLFTGAGVELDDAVVAMQGIGSASALAGVPLGSMNSIYDALSKSIGQGSLRLREWQRLELAGLGTSIEFKQQIIDTALEMGTLVEANGKYYTSLEDAQKQTEEAEVSVSNFGSALKDNWATTEVLMKVFSEYGEFANEVFDVVHDGTNEIVLASDAIAYLSKGVQGFSERGYRAAQEARSLTDAIDSINQAIAARWRVSWGIIIGDVDEATELWTDFTEAMWDVFVASGDLRNEMLEIWKDLGGRDAVIQGIVNAFEALAAVVAPIRDAFRDIFPETTGEQLYELSRRFEEFTSKLTISDETADKIQRTFTGLFAALDLVGMAVKAVFTVFGDLIGRLLPVGQGVLGVTASLGDFIVAIRDAAIESDVFSGAASLIGSLLDGIVAVIAWAADGIREGIDRIREYFSQFGGIDLGPMKVFTSEVEIAFTPFTAIAALFKKAWDVIVAVFEWAAPIVLPIAYKIKDAFVAFGSAIAEALRSGDIKALLDVVNTGLLGGVLLGLKRFVDGLADIGGVAGIVGNVTMLLDGVRGSLEAFQSSLKAKALLSIAAAIALLAGAILILSTIDGVDMAISLGAITVLFTELAAVMLVLSRLMGGVKLGAVAAQMVLISTAVLILSAAMKNLAVLDWEEVGKGTLAIGALIAMLTASATILSKSSGTLIKGGVGLIAFATAIVILTSAVRKLGEMDLDVLAKGLISVGVLMAEVAGFTQIVKPEKLISTGIAMIAMGTGLKIIASAVGDLGAISLVELAKGLGAVAVVLATYAGFTQIVKPEKLVSTGIAMIAMGAALKIIASAVAQFASMSLTDLAVGLGAMAVSLATLAGFTQIVDTTKIFTTGVAMIALGAALLIIAQAVKSFASMSWDELARGMVGLAGALVVLAAAMMAMKGSLAGAAAIMIVAPALLVLAGAMKVLGSMSLTEIGLALLALAGAFAVIGVAGLVLKPLIPTLLGLAGAMSLFGVAVLALGAGVLAFSIGLASLAVSGTAAAGALAAIVLTIIGLIPAAVIALAEGLVSFIAVIGESAPIIVEAIQSLIMALINLFVEMVPDLVAAIFVFVTAMLTALTDHLPELITAGVQLLLALLKGIAMNIKDVVVVALEIITEFLKGIAEGIKDVAAAGVDVVVAFLDALGKELPRVVDAGFQMVIDLVNGIADSIRTNTPLLVDAFFNLGSAMIDGLVDSFKAGVTRAVDGIKNLGQSIIDGFKGLLGIASPSKVFYEFGENTVDGYTDGIDDNVDEAEEAAKRMAQAAINAAYEKFEMKNSVSAIFKSLGVKNAESFIAGLDSMNEAIKTALEKTFTSEDDEPLLASMTDTIDQAFQTIEERITSYTELASDRMNKLSEESELTVREMITNLKHNQIVIAEWAENIATLAERGLNDGLLEELRQAGPSAAGEVRAIVAATDEELQELNAVMARSGSVATQALVTTVGEGAPLMVEPGQSLVEAVAQGLQSSSSVNDAMQLLIQQTKDSAVSAFDVPEFKKMGENITQGLAQGITENAEVPTAAGVTMAIRVAQATAAQFGIQSPSTVYAEYGENLMAGLEIGIRDNADKPVEALEGMYSTMAEVAESSGKKVSEAAEEGLLFNSDRFGSIGEQYGQEFSESLENKSENAKLSGTSVASSAEEGIKHNETVFGATGSKDGFDFSAELNNKKTSAFASGRNVASEAERGIKHNVQDFYDAGVAAGQGFIDGLASMIEEAVRVAKELAREASKAARSELRIKSPSRVFFEIGVHTGEGFVAGVSSMLGEVADSTAALADTAIDGVKDVIAAIAESVSQDVDSDMVVTPVLDLSEIQNGSNLLRQMLSGVSPTSRVGIATARISSGMNSRKESSGYDPDKVESAKGDTYYQFEQNNYSPKSLSRLEIYRQTRNQFAQVKGLVERA